MNHQDDAKWSGAVFALVCDNNLNYAANALALEMTTKINVDIHVFIETKHSLDYDIQRIEHPRIIYHHNELLNDIDTEIFDHPRFSRAAWGRIMLASALGDHKRIIYCDIDVLPGKFDPHILDIDLPHGIAMVRDQSDVLCHRKKLPENHSRFRIGNKYFNAGFIIIDPKKWDSSNVNTRLREFFSSGTASIAPYVDQDFLNVHFADRIVELSPLYNLQYNFMRLGAIRPKRVAIRHFSVDEKPYYKTRDITSRKIVEDGREEYQKILLNTDVNLEILPEKSMKPVRVLKSLLRKRIYDIGFKTKKTKNMLESWQRDRNLFLQYLHQGDKGEFHDNFTKEDIIDQQQPQFDGFEFYDKFDELLHHGHSAITPHQEKKSHDV